MKSRSVGLIVCIWSAASAHPPPPLPQPSRGCASIGFIWMSFPMAWPMGTDRTPHNKIALHDSGYPQHLQSGKDAPFPSPPSSAQLWGEEPADLPPVLPGEGSLSQRAQSTVTPQPVCASSLAAKLLLFSQPILHKGTIMLRFYPLTHVAALSLLKKKK